jgi:pyruvate dehydrogenase E1 component alpha subunit
MVAMLADEFDPLKGGTLQVLDNEGSVIAPALEPKLQPELLLRMHYAMLLSRLADERAIRLQRAGRMGTFAPSVGQEAIVGAAAALDAADWTVPSYRELPVHLFRGLPLEYVYLYFMGDARGNKIPETVHTLPIAVPVSTQVPHAVGFAWEIGRAHV